MDKQKINIHNALIERKQKLDDLRAALRETFLGLDDVIDEVVSLMMPWYLFPDAQLRPTIINLWGLTGSGKTALVQKIVEVLEHRRLYSHLDMGEFDSDSASWMKNILTDDLSFFHEKPALICLDEFQFARTVDSHQNELGKDKLRVVWDLIDSGKIEYIPNSSTYYLFRAENCLKRLEKAIEQGTTISNGIITSGLDVFVKQFKGFHFDYNNRFACKLDEHYFMSEDFVRSVASLFDNESFSRAEVRERVRVSTTAEVAQLLREAMNARPATKTLDLSRSLIFVLGNLDEAYTMSHNMNPDICADDYHEQTSRISLADIKRALRKRFRPEQIARLGNNHVIYKSFNRAQFRMLIRQELKRVGNFVTAKFGWKVTFDDSVVNVVYAEGVFPSQGTRPVLTTVKNLIESRISGLVVSILEYQLVIAEIVWKFEHGDFVYVLKDEGGHVVSTITDKAKLKLENLRRSVDPELQAHVAIHEAGHAVLAALTLRIVPSVVVSRTASDMEGFCMINFPKGPMTRDTLRKDIVITLGGFVAERMIFGEEMTSSGVYADIEEASSLANRAIRKYAMGVDPIHLAVENSDNEDAFILSDKYAGEAVKIVRESQMEAERILSQNKLLLLKMGEYLTTHSRMEEDMIEAYIKKYGREEWIHTDGLIKKEAYYKFNTVLQEQIRDLEDGTVEPDPDRVAYPLQEETLA